MANVYGDPRNRRTNAYKPPTGPGFRPPTTAYGGGGQSPFSGTAWATMQSNPGLFGGGYRGGGGRGGGDSRVRVGNRPPGVTDYYRGDNQARMLDEVSSGVSQGGTQNLADVLTGLPSGGMDGSGRLRGFYQAPGAGVGGPPALGGGKSPLGGGKG